MQREQLVAAGRLGALDHLLDDRVSGVDRGAFLVAQHLHVQQQRLFDLGRVEQAAQALGRKPRVVGEHDCGADDHVVVVRRQHRKGVDAVQAGVERRDEAAAERAQDRVRRDQRVAQCLGAVAQGGDVRQVLDAQRDALPVALEAHPQREPVEPELGGVPARRQRDVARLGLVARAARL
jgi:hypothetical protein